MFYIKKKLRRCVQIVFFFVYRRANNDIILVIFICKHNNIAIVLVLIFEIILLLSFLLRISLYTDGLKPFDLIELCIILQLWLSYHIIFILLCIILCIITINGSATPLKPHFHIGTVYTRYYKYSYYRNIHDIIMHVCNCRVLKLRYA